MPEQPGQGLGSLRPGSGKELPEFLGEVDEDRAGFEDTHRLRAAAIDQRGDLGVWVNVDEAARELLPFADANWPGVIFGVGMAFFEQLLEHDRDLLPIRCR